jgi:hypothetical protein
MLEAELVGTPVAQLTSPVAELVDSPAAAEPTSPVAAATVAADIAKPLDVANGYPSG